MKVIRPDWSAPESVRAFFTTREGGVSPLPYDSLNLGLHVGDDAANVEENRRRVREMLPAEPCWLDQVHGTRVIDAGSEGMRQADASFTRQEKIVCAIMTADCLPVLFAGKGVVGAAHAGWRGLASGILERTVEAIGDENLIAWLGPAIGPNAFEIGEEVLDAFPNENRAFFRLEGKWHADLFAISRMKLEKSGVRQVLGGHSCTHGSPEKFFSYRRDGSTGRMGAFVWLESI